MNARTKVPLAFCLVNPYNDYRTTQAPIIETLKISSAIDHHRLPGALRLIVLLCEENRLHPNGW